MNCMKKQRDMILEDEPPMSESVPYPTGEEQKTITNTSRKNAMAGPKQNDTQLWMYLLVKVKFDAVKAILYRNLDC